MAHEHARPRALILKRERELKILTFLWLTSVWNIHANVHWAVVNAIHRYKQEDVMSIGQLKTEFALLGLIKSSILWSNNYECTV